MHTFFCSDCNLSFEDQGEREERVDPIFGPTWRYVAQCPECENVALELKAALKASIDGSSESAASCPTGTCPFVN